MSRKTDDNEYGLMYEEDPLLGKTLTAFGAMVPWCICVLIIAPILIVAGGLPWFPVLMVMPWVGLLASVVWIEVNY